MTLASKVEADVCSTYRIRSLRWQHDENADVYEARVLAFAAMICANPNTSNDFLANCYKSPIKGAREAREKLAADPAFAKTAKAVARRADPELVPPEKPIATPALKPPVPERSTRVVVIPASGKLDEKARHGFVSNETASRVLTSIIAATCSETNTTLRDFRSTSRSDHLHRTRRVAAFLASSHSPHIAQEKMAREFDRNVVTIESYIKAARGEFESDESFRAIVTKIGTSLNIPIPAHS